MNLIDSLIQEGWLKTPRIIDAFRKIKRADFLPEDIKRLSEANEALPIGKGQTISQPLVVAFMIELVQPRPGEKILDIGSGSGWTTAILSEIVGDKGKVVAVEVVPELAESGKKNIEKYNFIEKGITRVLWADGTKGYAGGAPFDKILCSAAIQKEVPPAWKEQLKVGGRIVTPILSSIWLLIKNPPVEGKPRFEEKEYPGFVFVPLIPS